jgi:predicted nucleic acid-binding protein
MKLTHLIDTDWIIHYLNGNKGIIEKIRSLEKSGLAVSVVSLAELYDRKHYEVVDSLNIFSLSYTKPEPA